MKVQWSIYAPLERRVIAQFVTEGRWKQEQPTKTIFPVLFISAFGRSAEALGADRKFLKMVSRPVMDAMAVHTPTAASPISIASLERSRTDLSIDSTPVLDSTVTIRSSNGHGSGFIVSRNGYVITNHHVVGESKEVRVIFASRLEVNGRVVRSHRVRDVALIKIQIGGLRPLPIRAELPRIAEPVYAIGSPLKEDLQSTITRGIVSALRKNEQTKLEFIQADVDIAGGNSGGPLVDLRGNVLGISVSGIGVGQLSAGLNFFIPIADALRLLNVKLASGE